MERIISLLISALVAIIGIVIHESAHALAAYVLGDATARSRGRVSLNPLKHIDPFGTVLLPILMILAGGPVFAYAKPVPVYLGNLKHPKRDEVLVAFAGPVSNIVLALLFAGILHLALPALIASGLSADAVYLLVDALITGMMTNLSLAFFNLIPLPPLDGSSILVPFLHGKALNTFYRIQQYAMPILIIVLYILPSVLNIDLIGAYYSVTVYPLGNWLLSLALS